MIETLQQLVQAANVERLNLSIQAVSETRTAVVVQAILRPEPNDSSDEQRRLRKALSQPIMVEGLTGEVDATFDRILTKHVEAVRLPLSTLVTNAEKVAEDVAKAQQPEEQKAEDSPEREADAEQSDDTGATQTATKVESSIDDLASGDADSL